MPLSPRTQRRVDRIHQEVPIGKLLESYGYRVHGNASQEQQFPCDLHGDGHDNKPSGRFYPLTNSWYCFACNRTRDAIATVQEKEGKSFTEAIQSLERQFGLPSLPWEEGDVPQKSDLISFDSKPVSYTEEQHRTERFLRMATEDHLLPLPRILTLWEAFDRASLASPEKGAPEEKAIGLMQKIRCTAMESITEEGVS